MRKRELLSTLTPVAEKYPYKAVGLLIREAREESGLTQEDAAAETGVSRAQWIKWEKGQSRPSRKLADLAAVLNLDPVEIQLLGDVAALRSRAAADLEEAERLAAELAQHRDGQRSRAAQRSRR